MEIENVQTLQWKTFRCTHAHTYHKSIEVRGFENVNIIAKYSDRHTINTIRIQKTETLTLGYTGDKLSPIITINYEEST